MKLNKSNVDAIPLTTKGQKIYRDTDLIGFAINSSTKSKSYIVERRYKGKLYRVVLGRTNEITPIEARRKAQSILADIANGLYEKKNDELNSQLTLEEAFDLYLSQRKLKPLSINTYNHCINTFLPDWKKKQIFEITKKEVFDKFIKLTDYSPTQANLALKMFGSIWKFAQVHCSTDENPILKHNPVDVIPAKRGWNKTKVRTRHLDESNIHIYYNAVLNYFTERSLYDDAAKNATRDFVLFVMYTGCRRNEAQTLKWENVDIEKGLFVFKDPKNGDDHLLPMGDHLFEIIKQRYELRGNEYVFPGSGMISSAKHISGAQGLLDALEKQTGIAISLHDLRRTFATICNNLDYGPYTIKRLLNHRSGARNDVTGGYVQVSLKKLRLAMNDIEAVYPVYERIAVITPAKKIYETRVINGVELRKRIDDVPGKVEIQQGKVGSANFFRVRNQLAVQIQKEMIKNNFKPNNAQGDLSNIAKGLAEVVLRGHVTVKAMCSACQGLGKLELFDDKGFHCGAKPCVKCESSGKRPYTLHEKITIAKLKVSKSGYSERYAKYELLGESIVAGWENQIRDQLARSYRFELDAVECA